MGKLKFEYMNPPVETDNSLVQNPISGIGNRLRALRRKSGMSARETCMRLAREYDLKIQENTLVTYESERRIPNAEIFLALCNMYHCENILDYFHIGEDRRDSIVLNNYDREGVVEELFVQYGKAGCKDIIKLMIDKLSE